MASRMNRIFFLAVLSVQPLLGVAAESASSGPAPEHYSLTLRPVFDKNSFDGREEIRVRLSESTASISINAADITFDEVQVVSGSAKQVGKVVLDKEKELATISVDQLYMGAQSTDGVNQARYHFTSPFTMTSGENYQTVAADWTVDWNNGGDLTMTAGTGDTGNGLVSSAATATYLAGVWGEVLYTGATFT